MTPEEMWAEYKKTAQSAASYEAWAFCGGGALGDRLAALVLAGKKTATASALVAYETEKEPLPAVGACSVVLYDNGQAACVIRDTAVRLVPFDEVSPRHARLEGEGDGSLLFWRQVHREAFTPDYRQAGRPFDEHGLCVLEEFQVVYPLGQAE